MEQVEFVAPYRGYEVFSKVKEDGGVEYIAYERNDISVAARKGTLTEIMGEIDGILQKRKEAAG